MRKLYFDGAANSTGNGVRVVLVSPKGQQIPISVKLNFDCTNNVMEYEACIVGLQVALEFDAYDLSIFKDSLLIISQIEGKWQAQDTKLIPYQKCVKRNHDSTLLRCVDVSEANHLMEKMHEGLLGAHANGPLLAHKIIRSGYYWLTMKNDCIKHVRTCHHCQAYQDRKNAPPQPLHSLAAPRPFLAWGVDVIRLVIPKASNSHEYILMAIDYFTKWVEATSYKSVTQAMLARFLKHSIICRYGVLGEPVTNNGT